MTCGQMDRDGRTLILLKGRNKDLEAKYHLAPFTSYFYGGITKDMIAIAENSGREVIYDIVDRPTIKIKRMLSSEVGDLRELYPFTCEAKVLVYDRFCIDKGITIGYEIDGKNISGCEALGIKPLIMYFDIETSIHPEYDRLEGVWPIISIQCSNNYNWDIVVFVIDPFDKYPDEHLFILGDSINDNIIKERVGLIGLDEFVIVAETRRFKKDKEYTAEKKLLMGWLKYLRKEVASMGDPDELQGWYSNYFDIPEIMRAMLRNGIDIRWLSNVFKSGKRYNPAYAKLVAFPQKRGGGSKYGQVQFPYIMGRECIDMLDNYKKINVTSQRIIASWDFKDVCRDEFNLVYRDIAADMREYHLNKPIESLDYMVTEAVALKMFDMVVGQSEHFQNYREIFGVKKQDTMSMNHMYKILLLRLATEPLPTRSPSKKKGQKGGKVIVPAKAGVVTWVAYLDFRALYPFILGEENCGLETLMERTDRIAIFTKTKKSLMVQAMEKPRDRREELRAEQLALDPNAPLSGFIKKKLKRKEASMKSAANSSYGVLAYAKNPVYSWEANQKVTFEAREALTWMIEELRKVEYDVVQADTDGCGVELDISYPFGEEDTLDGHIKAALLLKDFVNYKIQEYAKERGWSTPPEIKLEKIAKAVLFQFKRKDKELAKKKYVLYAVWEDGFKVKKIINMGTQSKRSDTAPLTRRMLNEFYDKILIDEDTEGALQVIRDAYNRIINRDANQREIGVPHGLQTAGEGYWVRKAVKYAEDVMGERYNRNMKPRILYVKGTKNGPSTKHLAIVNDNVYDESIVEIDYETTAEKIVLNKIEPFLRSLGMSVEGLLRGQKQLDGFINARIRI